MVQKPERVQSCTARCCHNGWSRNKSTSTITFSSAWFGIDIVVTSPGWGADYALSRFAYALLDLSRVKRPGRVVQVPRLNLRGVQALYRELVADDVSGG